MNLNKKIVPRGFVKIFKKLSLIVVLSNFTFSALASDKNQKKIFSKFNCGKSPLEKSECLISEILKDLRVTYKLGKSGGGISEIKEISTNTYRVSLPQEERIDIITFVFSVDDLGRCELIRRIETTESSGLRK